MNSSELMEKSKLHTCEPVSMLSINTCELIFQNLIHRSLFPPPLTRIFDYFGCHAIAFTAALWSENLIISELAFKFQMINLLSLPPDAISFLSGDHFSPQTSYLCPKNLCCIFYGHLISL